MDALEINFTRLLRAGELDAAQAALAKWASHSPMSEAENAVWSSLILSRRGESRASIDLLSAVIDRGGDPFRICLSQRARRFFNLGDFRSALADYRVILGDTAPKVSEIFHLTAQYNAAFCLARLGSPDFVSEIAKVSPGYAEWNMGRNWTVADLWTLFSQSAKESFIRRTDP